MLMKLAANTQQDIASAVHQAAQFLHVPCQWYTNAVRHILWYLKATSHKRMLLSTTIEHQVDCYVDDDFA
jgi:hypothetical protein